MMILVKFLIILLLLVNVQMSSGTKTSLAILSHSPRFYVNGLISDWNQKYQATNQVVVLNIGMKSYLHRKMIPEDNPLIIADPKQCSLFEKRKAEFVVITSDTFHYVRIVF
jgi:hypothetical protein